MFVASSKYVKMWSSLIKTHKCNRCFIIVWLLIRHATALFYYCVAANQTCYSFAKHTFTDVCVCVCVWEWYQQLQLTLLKYCKCNHLWDCCNHNVFVCHVAFVRSCRWLAVGQPVSFIPVNKIFWTCSPKIRVLFIHGDKCLFVLLVSHSLKRLI